LNNKAIPFEVPQLFARDKLGSIASAPPMVWNEGNKYGASYAFDEDIIALLWGRIATIRECVRATKVPADPLALHAHALLFESLSFTEQAWTPRTFQHHKLGWMMHGIDANMPSPLDQNHLSMAILIGFSMLDAEMYGEAGLHTTRHDSGIPGPITWRKS